MEPVTCIYCHVFFFQAEDGIRDLTVTGVQTCALPICTDWTWPCGCSPYSRWSPSGSGSRTSTGRTGRPCGERGGGRLCGGLAGGPGAARPGGPRAVPGGRGRRGPARRPRGCPAAGQPAPGLPGTVRTGAGCVGTQGDALVPAVLPGGVPAAVDVHRPDPALLPPRRPRDARRERRGRAGFGRRAAARRQLGHGRCLGRRDGLADRHGRRAAPARRALPAVPRLPAGARDGDHPVDRGRTVAPGRAAGKARQGVRGPPARRPGPARARGRGGVLRGAHDHAGRTRPARPAQRCAAVRGRYVVRAGRSGRPAVRAVAGPDRGAPGRPGPRAHPDPGRSLRGRDRAASRGLAHAPTDVEVMVRVGIVCPYSFDVPGGVQNHVRDLAETLIALGHEASVLAPADEDVPQPPYLVSAGRSVPVRYNGSVARLSFGPISAARVRKWLAARRLDVLHVHQPVTPSVSMLAVLYARTPIVATFHTATTRSRAMAAAQGLLRVVLEKITARIAVSDLARRVQVEHLDGGGWEIPNGVAVAKFADAVPLPGWPGPGGAVGFLGRFTESRKGFPILLNALSRLGPHRPDLRLLVAGPGDPDEVMAERARAIRERVTFLGKGSEPDKARMLRSVDLYVAPNTGGAAFGMILTEAMAAGTPVVARDMDPFRPVLDGGRARGPFPVGG